MSKNIHHTGITGYMSDRYGPPKPEIETVLYVKQGELTLAHLHELINMTDNYPENTPVNIYDDFIQVVREATKPVEIHHRGGGHLHWSTGGDDEVEISEWEKELIKKRDLPPRDHLGRFTKRK